MVAASYPFLDVFWTMIVIVAWVVWLWLLITVFGDLFRRRDTTGVKKAIWVIFLVLTPYLGVLAYMILNHDGMVERSVKQAQQQQQAVEGYIREVAGGAAAEIERAKSLLESGAITQAEFDALKAKALA